MIALERRLTATRLAGTYIIAMRVKILIDQGSLLLADVLCATDKEEQVVQASEIHKKCIRMLDKLYGLENRATLVAKTGLTRAYINLRLFKEAEIVAMEVFENYSSESRDDIALRLAALCDLASIALECGKYDKAIERHFK
ncbi:MAG: hypothetical protein Q9214_004874 [Letrouitia sp. 1 TL-2023]